MMDNSHTSDGTEKRTSSSSVCFYFCPPFFYMFLKRCHRFQTCVCTSLQGITFQSCRPLFRIIHSCCCCRQSPGGCHPPSLSLILFFFPPSLFDFIFILISKAPKESRESALLEFLDPSRLATLRFYIHIVTYQKLFITPQM